MTVISRLDDFGTTQQSEIINNLHFPGFHLVATDFP